MVKVTLATKNNNYFDVMITPTRSSFSIVGDRFRDINILLNSHYCIPITLSKNYHLHHSTRQPHLNRLINRHRQISPIYSIFCRRIYLKEFLLFKRQKKINIRKLWSLFQVFFFLKYISSIARSEIIL